MIKGISPVYTMKCKNYFSFNSFWLFYPAVIYKSNPEINTLPPGSTVFSGRNTVVVVVVVCLFLFSSFLFKTLKYPHFLFCGCLDYPLYTCCHSPWREVLIPCGSLSRVPLWHTSLWSLPYAANYWQQVRWQGPATVISPHYRWSHLNTKKPLLGPGLWCTNSNLSEWLE